MAAFGGGLDSGLCPVNTHNEWDPLEEVIVGRVDGAVIPPFHVVERVRAVTPLGSLVARLVGGMRYPGFIVKKAQQELDAFIGILEGEGVTVRRPDRANFSRRVRAPGWTSRGFCTASPRDMILVLGDLMIETASAWRSRYFEVHAYRTLLNHYSRQGARWIAAPRPVLDDGLFNRDFRVPPEGAPAQFVTTEQEPVLDAADFARCGRDLFVTRSNSTNLSGIDWLRRVVEPDYRIHVLPTRDRVPMHIDTTFIPLAPGRVMINPVHLDASAMPAAIRNWEFLVPPPPDPVKNLATPFLSLTSSWIHLNVLSLDERRVVVEQSQTSLIRALRDWGFEPIPCPFIHYRVFGGGFHCATLDIRRRGELKSYPG